MSMTEQEQMANSAWLDQAGLAVASAQGVDVSNFQGAYDWAAQRGRIQFGIYRLTQGLSTPGTGSPDPAAQHNHDGIRALGICHGAYHFLDPRENGAAQAATFIAAHTAIGLGPADMLWLDNETAGASPAATAACAQAFMTELDKLAPHNPRGVYTFISFATGGHCAGLGHYPLWLAYPASAAPVPPPPWAHWTFWQWGQRNGVDRDAFNGPAAELAAWIASFTAPPPARGGPWLHIAGGKQSLQQIAAARGVTEQHLRAVSAQGYDMALSATPLQRGTPYWTSNQ